MARIKVHELAKELNRTSKDILNFLQEKGMGVKVAQSSLDDEVVKIVRDEMGSAEKENASKEEKIKPKTETKAEDKTLLEQEGKTESKTLKTKETQRKADEKEEAKAEPKKKKKIIIISNQQNSEISPQKPQSQNSKNSQVSQGSQKGKQSQQSKGNKNTQNGQTNRTNQTIRSQAAPIRPIKPLTPPSPTPSVQMVPPKPQQSKSRQTEKKQTEKIADKITEKISEKVLETPVNLVETPEKSVLDQKTQDSKLLENQVQENNQENKKKESKNQESKSQENKSQEGKGQENRSQENRSQENKSQENKSQEGKGQENRSQGNRNQGNKNQGNRNQENKTQSSRSQERTAQNAHSQEKRFHGNRLNGSNEERNERSSQGGRQGNQFQGNRGGANGRRQDGTQKAAKFGSEGGQDNRRTSNGGQGSGRGFGSSNRDSRGNGGQGDKFRGQASSKGFISEAPSKDAEKKREEEKRRFSQEKDKRSRKDFIYEEEEILKTKPGRFIKPEKKKEEKVEEVIKVIYLPESITIKELAERMKQQPAAIIKKLFLEGKIVTVNQEISYEDAENIAMEYDILCEKEVKVDVIEELLKEEEDAEEELMERPPVICVMGHVDHGKTSLLDAIRKTNVTDKEAGGITQHIGAYTVNAGGRRITFLDTPGHEAFTAMRMRGANATDIAILVVAADDGVMPQTVEAINHAKAAGIEIIVAVNKIDKPSANIDRVKQELAEYELIPEDWGGSTIFVPVSAKSGEGISSLLEMILLTADILELKANPKRRARGLVIEAELDKGRGPVATILVQKGTLHVGDFISAGSSHGKVRAMIDDKGRRVKEADPSTPVEILGLSDVPSAGEVFLAHENDKTAKSYAETYLAQNKEKMLEETKSKMSLDELFSQIQEGNLKELDLIVKADVQGSVEAVKQSLLKLTNEEVVVKCIHGGVGAINESDVMLASASNAIIIGFNVRPDATAKTTAEREGVDIRLYKVIYQAIEDIEAAMKGMLDPVFEEKIIGHAEVRQIFKASAVGNIAGSYVLDGIFQRGCKIRISREGKQIYEGNLASLKRFKDDVKEVKAGYECGLVFEGYDQMQELDIVEAYIMVEVPR